VWAFRISWRRRCLVGLTRSALADADLTAYPGAGARETVVGGDSWRRLLDLTQPLEAPEPAAVDKALRDFVVGAGNGALLSDRRAARDAYRALLERGSGWLAPWYIRAEMGTWSFARATTRMTEATAVLELRDKVATAADSLGLTPDSALKDAYEGAKDNFDDATALANRQLEALAAIAAAQTIVEGTPDLPTQIGLIGETPRVTYDAARAAFGTGDLDQAVTLSANATALITGAAAVGQQRLIVAIGTTIGVILLLIILAVLLRRRSRRRRAGALAASAAAAAGPATDLAPPEPYGTLAPDPAMDQDEGGHARGDMPADP
jgi:hypothetical protein